MTTLLSHCVVWGSRRCPQVPGAQSSGGVSHFQQDCSEFPTLGFWTPAAISSRLTLTSASSSAVPPPTPGLYLPLISLEPNPSILTTSHSPLAYTRCAVGLGEPFCSCEVHGEGSQDRTWLSSLSDYTFSNQVPTYPSPLSSSFSIGSKRSVLVLEKACLHLSLKL